MDFNNALSKKLIMRVLFIISVYILLLSTSAFSQKVDISMKNLEANHVYLSEVKLNGEDVTRITKDSSIKEVDQPTFARLKGLDFANGTIEVKVLSRLLPNAPELARGFIGIAFRINDDNSKFESIYIRPTNGRVENQLRRNRSIQYFSYPDFRFERLRKENAGEYESYADMGLDEWVKLTIVIKDSEARLFLNNNNQPSLIVKDLKHGSYQSGGIGLWVDVGTEGFFSDFKITKN